MEREQESTAPDRLLSHEIDQSTGDGCLHDEEVAIPSPEATDLGTTPGRAHNVQPAAWNGNKSCNGRDPDQEQLTGSGLVQQTHEQIQDKSNPQNQQREHAFSDDHAVEMLTLCAMVDHQWCDASEQVCEVLKTASDHRPRVHGHVRSAVVGKQSVGDGKSDVQRE